MLCLQLIRMAIISVSYTHLSTDFFGLLDDLMQAVRQGDVEGIASIILPKLDEAIDDILCVRTQAGALQKRYQTSSSRLKQMNLNYNELYSKVSDTDLAEAVTKFAMAQAVYQASLATIARIIQPTLCLLYTSRCV